MMTDEISEFLEKIDSEHFNCVYSCNGMTLMQMFRPDRDPLHPDVRKTYIISKNDLEDYIRLIFDIGVEEEVDVVWTDN